jgi:hypothetical protein
MKNDAYIKNIKHMQQDAQKLKKYYGYKQDFCAEGLLLGLAAELS